MLRARADRADAVGVAEYFARPTSSAEHRAAYLDGFGDRTPAPHELRLDLPHQRERTTRWGPTVTTFGPWVKVPVSLYLVVRPIFGLLRALVDGTFPTGPYAALAMVTYALFIGVGLWIASTMWRPGKVDTRPRGTRSRHE